MLPVFLERWYCPIKYIKRKKEAWKRKQSGITMTDKVSYPTPELLEKVGQTAMLHKELQRSKHTVDLCIPNQDIKTLMTEDTFQLPLEPNQPGSELYRRIIFKYGITPAILRGLHVHHHFSEVEVDMHLKYLRETYKLNMKRTKSDMPWGALFMQADVDLFNSNVALRSAVQPAVSR